MNDRRSFIGSVIAAIAGLIWTPREAESQLQRITICHDPLGECSDNCPCCSPFSDNFNIGDEWVVEFGGGPVWRCEFEGSGTEAKVNITQL